MRKAGMVMPATNTPAAPSGDRRKVFRGRSRGGVSGRSGSGVLLRVRGTRHRQQSIATML